MNDIFKQGRREPIESDYWVGILQNNLTSSVRPSRLNIFGSNAGLCSRQTAGMILLDHNHVQEQGASSQFYFKIGSAFEKVVKAAFTNKGLTFTDEMRVEDRLAPNTPSVSGRVDFVVEEGGELTLVELKSCGKLPDKPKPAHLAQLTTYLFLTGAPKGVLFYISRDVADFKGNLKAVAFDVIPTEQELYDVGLQIAIGAIGASRQLVPQIPEHMKQYKCGFCALRDHCWNGDPMKFDGRHANAKDQLDLDVLAEKVVDDFMATRNEKYKELKQRFNDEHGFVW